MPAKKKQQQQPEAPSSKAAAAPPSDDADLKRLLSRINAPPFDDYVVPGNPAANLLGGTVVGASSSSANEFAGVRVTRGTLALFGDDTAKQFALHIDKLMRSQQQQQPQQAANNSNTGLLVKNGDVSNRAAVLRHSAVPAFERHMETLLNSSARQGAELRQREDDDARGGGDGGDDDANAKGTLGGGGSDSD